MIILSRALAWARAALQRPAPRPPELDVHPLHEWTDEELRRVLAAIYAPEPKPRAIPSGHSARVEYERAWGVAWEAHRSGRISWEQYRYTVKAAWDEYQHQIADAPEQGPDAR